MVHWFGWRAAFAIPGLLAIGAGLLSHASARASRGAGNVQGAGDADTGTDGARVCGHDRGFGQRRAAPGNAQLLTERFRGTVEDPALLGAMLAAVYAVASLAQVVVGRLIDRVPLKPLYLGVAMMQIPLLALAAHAQGWWLLVLLLAVMVFIFGSIPFTDAMIVRYVDDRIRSRVAGARLTVSIGISSLAVWLLGPVVKASSFGALLWGMALIAACTVAMVAWLPGEKDVGAP